MIYYNSVLFHDVADRATFTSVPTTLKSSEDLLKEDNSPDPVVAEWIELFPLDLSSLLLHSVNMGLLGTGYLMMMSTLL